MAQSAGVSRRDLQDYYSFADVDLGGLIVQIIAREIEVVDKLVPQPLGFYPYVLNSQKCVSSVSSYVPFVCFLHISGNLWHRKLHFASQNFIGLN